MKKRLISLWLVLSMMMPLLNWTEVVAEEQEIITPYAYSNAVQQTDSTSIAGESFSDAILFRMGYTGLDNGNTAEVTYSLKGKYKSMSFCAGFVTGEERNAELTIIADGTMIYDKDILTPNQAAKRYTISLVGVDQLVIRFHITRYDFVRYAIGGISMVKAATWTEDETYVSDEFFDVTRSNLQNCEVLTGDFTMGGNRYTAGYRFRTGYNGTSSGNTGKVSFNFDGKYKQMTFDFARYMNRIPESYTWSAKLTIEMDGVVLEQFNQRQVKWNDTVLHVKLDLTGVKKMTITVVSSTGDRVYWNMGNIQLMSDGNAHGVLLAATKVTLTSSSPNYQLKPRVYPSDAVNKEYTVDHTSPITALVSETGDIFGRHKGTTVVTVKTKDGGHTATCSVTSKLANARYMPSRDGWGFGNTEAGTMLDDDLKNVYQRISDDYTAYKTYKDLGIQNLSKLFSASDFLWNSLAGFYAGGICTGMSLSSALTNTGDIPFSTWNSSYGNPYSVTSFEGAHGAYSSSLDMSLKQFIFACHLAQATVPYLVDEYTSADDYEALFEAVKRFQSGGSPVVLHLSSDGACHAVLPYEILERENEVLMFIYEPNALNGFWKPEISNAKNHPDSYYITFQLNAEGKVNYWKYQETGKWLYQMSNTKLRMVGSLSTYANRLKAQQNLGMANTVLYTSAAKYYVQKGSTVLFTYNNGQIWCNPDQSIATPFSLSEMGNSRELAGSAICLSENSGITIHVEDESGAMTAIYGPDYAYVIETDKNAEIQKIGSGKTICIESESNDNISVRYNNSESSLIAQGTVPDALTVTIGSDGAMIASGYSDVQATTIINEQEQKSEKIQIGEENACLISTANGVTVEALSSIIKESAYENCGNLSHFELPPEIVAIGDYAFRNCSSLTSLVIPNRVLYIGKDAFEGCTNLTLVVGRDSYAWWYCVENQIPYVFE